MKDFDYYNNTSDTGILEELENNYVSRRKEIGHTRRVVDDVLGDDQVEFQEWHIFK